MQNYELNYTTIVLKFTKNDEPNQMEAKPEVKEFPSEGFFFGLLSSKMSVDVLYT